MRHPVPEDTDGIITAPAFFPLNLQHFRNFISKNSIATRKRKQPGLSLPGKRLPGLIIPSVVLFVSLTSPSRTCLLRLLSVCHLDNLILCPLHPHPTPMHLCPSRKHYHLLFNNMKYLTDVTTQLQACPVPLGSNSKSPSVDSKLLLESETRCRLS